MLAEIFKPEEHWANCDVERPTIVELMSNWLKSPITITVIKFGPKRQ
jgi:hypothetical protein